MARQLKRWESPRREGRNNKGKGGSARQRQLKKQQQMLRKKLKEQSESDNQKQRRGGNNNSSPIFLSGLDNSQFIESRRKTLLLLGQGYKAGKKEGFDTPLFC